MKETKLYKTIITIPIVNEIFLMHFIEKGYTFDDLQGWR
jgi:hypothetical protein